MNRLTVVVPCYNEGRRLDPGGFGELTAASPDISLLFVNDGSSDDTEERLREIERTRPSQIGVLSLSKNVGKGEAVRRGMLSAFDDGPDAVGYYDADLSTPPSELLRMWDVLRDKDIAVLLAARVGLLGTAIERHAFRHFSGRVFATFASMALNLRVYDTQCGAKLFAASPALRAALADPFVSRWAFDVELLGRLLTGTEHIAPLRQDELQELPLQAWADVPGSKLHIGSMVKTTSELLLIAADLARRARRRKRS
ncbi:glycosyltransferase [Pendulispora brunnea]|uniref:Glycosyltransferase n=1 Tax=Pendulispora brunnea TaxID=2905690 RepID=A0ABZ2KI09_9BACT